MLGQDDGRKDMISIAMFGAVVMVLSAVAWITISIQEARIKYLEKIIKDKGLGKLLK